MADFVIQIEHFYAVVNDLCGKGTLNPQAVIDQMKVGFAPRVKSLLGSSVHKKYLAIIIKDEDKPLFAMFAGIAYLRDTMYKRLLSAISEYYQKKSDTDQV